MTAIYIIATARTNLVAGFGFGIGIFFCLFVCLFVCSVWIRLGCPILERIPQRISSFWSMANCSEGVSFLSFCSSYDWSTLICCLSHVWSANGWFLLPCSIGLAKVSVSLMQSDDMQHSSIPKVKYNFKECHPPCVGKLDRREGSQKHNSYDI